MTFRPTLILSVLSLFGWLVWSLLVESAMPSTFVKTASDMCGYRFGQAFTRVETSWFPPRARCIDAYGDGGPEVREYIPIGLSLSLGIVSVLLAALTAAAFALPVPRLRRPLAAPIQVAGLYVLGALAVAAWPLFTVLFVETGIRILAGLCGLPDRLPFHAAAIALAFPLLAGAVAGLAVVLESLTRGPEGARKGTWRRGALMGVAAGLVLACVQAGESAGLPADSGTAYPSMVAGLILASLGCAQRMKASRRAGGVAAPLLALALLSFQGCATLLPPLYRPYSNEIGFTELQVAKDAWEVQYVGPPSLTPLEAKQMAVLRAAELTRLRGGRWFSIEAEIEDSRHAGPACGDSSGAGVRRREARAPQATLRFHVEPAEGTASLDAESVLRQGREQGLRSRTY
jgi:hypothetical protein